MNTPTQPTTTKQAALDEYMASVIADTIAHYKDLGYTDIRVTETGGKYRITGTKQPPITHDHICPACDCWWDCARDECANEEEWYCSECLDEIPPDDEPYYPY